MPELDAVTWVLILAAGFTAGLGGRRGLIVRLVVDIVG